MTTISLIPAVPAVTKVVTTEVPAKVAFELSLEDAGKVRALLGLAKYGLLRGLYDSLENLRKVGAIPSYRVVEADRTPSLSFAPGNPLHD